MYIVSFQERTLHGYRDRIRRLDWFPSLSTASRRRQEACREREPVYTTDLYKPIELQLYVQTTPFV